MQKKSSCASRSGAWGHLLVHVFDRGYASALWLQVLEKYRARFVIRWIKNHWFLTAWGAEVKLWQIGQGKKYFAHKEIRYPKTGVRGALRPMVDGGSSSEFGATTVSGESTRETRGNVFDYQ